MRRRTIPAFASPLAHRIAYRMNGAGNRIVALDLRADGPVLSSAEIRAIHAGAGLAFDQLMAIYAPRDARSAAYVRIYNNDGGEAGACGNGSRCVAYLLMRGASADQLCIETAAGLLECRRLGPLVYSVDMGAPKFDWRDIPLSRSVADTMRVELGDNFAAQGVPSLVSVVNMGNPHAVIFVENADALDLAELGPPRERHPLFPERANVSFAEMRARDHIRLRVWERGVGITLACGSAACATLAAAARAGLSERSARISLPGGDLQLEWRAGDDHIVMTGPVELEAEILLESKLFRDIAA